MHITPTSLQQAQGYSAAQLARFQSGQRNVRAISQNGVDDSQTQPSASVDSGLAQQVGPLQAMHGTLMEALKSNQSIHDQSLLSLIQ